MRWVCLEGKGIDGEQLYNNFISARSDRKQSGKEFTLDKTPAQLTMTWMKEKGQRVNWNDGAWKCSVIEPFSTLF